MSAPLILVTCDRDIVGDPPRLADCTHATYVEAVARAGGMPLLLPCVDPGSLTEALARADGVLLVGGRDYRVAGTHPTCEFSHPARERRDVALWRVLSTTHHAVLGICLGMQLMALGAGGSLYRDIASEVPGAQAHKGRHHAVRLAPDSRLGNLLGVNLRVNSSHHQAVRRLTPGFKPVGWSLDGIVEAVEAPTQRFLVGVQWHPERMARSTSARLLFRAFVEAASRGGGWP